MGRMVWLIALMANAVLASLVDVGGVFAQTPPTATLRYAIPYPGIDVLPLYVAREAGYFREEGLELEVSALSSGDKITLALVSGSVDVAFYTPDWYIRAIEKGDAKIKIVLGGSNVPIYSLVVPNSIQSYADLKGKRIAASSLKASDAYLVQKMFAAHHLAPSDYVLIQAGAVTERAAALKSGSVSATLIIPPFDQRVIDEGGYKRLDLSSNVVTHYAWGNQAVREDWARANRAVLVSFIRGWIKATRWLYDQSNRDQAVQIISKELKIDPRLAGIVYEMYFRSGTETIAKDGAIDLVALQEVINAMVEQGDIPGPAPQAQKYLDLSYWEEARTTLR